jgi:aldehyde:ferredoxin oxidoreductase
MGSKNLKAIAVKGNGLVKIKDPDKFLDLADQTSKRLRGLQGSKGRREFGLVASPLYNQLSAIPKNY